MSRDWLWMIALLLAAATMQLPAQTAAPSGEVGTPFLRNFTPKEYNAHGQNWAVVQDHRGMIYAGNHRGVLEFDGSSWRLIRTANLTSVRSLDVDAAGRIYVGAIGDFGYLEPDQVGRTRYVSLLERLPPEARDFADVTRLFATPQGVYFMSARRLFLLDGGKVRVWSPSARFASVFRLRERLFVMEDDRGLMEMLDGELRLIPGGERFARDPVYAMLPWQGGGDSPAGSILIGATLTGFYIHDGSSLRPFATPVAATLVRDLPSSAILLQNGSVVVGTLQSGVYFLDSRGRLLDHLDKTSGLQDDNVKTLFEDGAGRLWMGLNRGLALIQTQLPLSRLDEHNGLRGTPLCMARHDGRLYVGTSQGLFHLDAGMHPQFQLSAGIRSRTWSLLSVGGSLLVASTGGIRELRGDRAVLVLETKAADFLHASKSRPGTVYVGLYDGLALLRNEGGRWQFAGLVSGVTDDIRTLLETADGRLWAGTRTTGVLRLSLPATADAQGAPTLQRFGTQDGLPQLIDNNVYLGDGDVLFGTRQGVLRFDEASGRFAPDPRFRALHTQGQRWVNDLTEDSGQRIWMYSEDEALGIKETGAALVQPDGSYRWDPQPLRPILGSQTTSIHADQDGVVWFGGDEGLVRLDSGVAPQPHSESFTAMVRQVSHNGGAVVFGGSGQPTAPLLNYAENSLRFEFAAPSFADPTAVRFQVLLEGNDQDWSPWTAEAHRDYTNLREGAYRFRVRARDLHDRMSSEGTYRFRVLPPWYRTLWAYLFYVLAVSMSGWGVVQFRLRRIQAEKRALEATVAARTGELSAKNAQLETLNAIVKSINGPMDFDQLLESILGASRVIRGVTKAAALVRVPGMSVFRFRAVLGQTREETLGIELGLADAQARYAAAADAVSEDVFLTRWDESRTLPPKLGALQPPKALIVVRIRIEGQVEGFFLFANHENAEAFAEHDLELLQGLKEHIVAAFQRARERAATEEARARAEAAAEAKSAFLANMSHEIRTPMNAVIGLSHLALRSAVDDRQRDYLKNIHGAGTSLLGVINDILDFSKIEAGHLSVERTRFDLDQVLASVATVVGQKAHDKGLELLVSIAPDVPNELEGDPLRLGQVITNLVGNAVKFTERGEIRVRVSVFERSDGRVKLRFAIEDTGIGMSPEQATRLFQPFSQADASTTRKHGGTGLGLSISKRLVELMGGEIGLQSQVGVGSTFYFTAWLSLGAQANPPRIPGELSRLRVLVVDDNMAAREVLSGALEGLVACVDAVASGADAVAAVEKHDGVDPYDLVFMDWRMPGMDGLEATQRLKWHATLRNVPSVIMVSAFSRAEIPEQGRALAIDGFLQKPVTRSTLVDSLVTLYAPGDPELAQASEDTPEGLSLNGIRLLLVEDNAINQQIAVELLESAGAAVTVADNGRIAVELLEAAPDLGVFDLILMDLQMPEMDGHQATRRIRGMPRWCDIPIIAMTAHATLEERQNCLAQGMVDHIAKPIDPANLYRTLLRHLAVAPTQPAATADAPAVPGQPAAQASAAGCDFPAVPGLDRADGLARVGGNLKLYRKLLSQFAGGQLDTSERLRTLLEAGDGATAERLAHTLVGVAGNLGAKTVQAAARQLELAISRRQPSASLDALRAELERALSELLGPLKAALEQPTGATPEAAAQPVDPVLAEAVMRRLRALVEECNAEASACVETHREILRGILGATVLTALDRAIEGYDFDEALAQLDKADPARSDVRPD